MIAPVSRTQVARELGAARPDVLLALGAQMADAGMSVVDIERVRAADAKRARRAARRLR